MELLFVLLILAFVLFYRDTETVSEPRDNSLEARSRREYDSNGEIKW